MVCDQSEKNAAGGQPKSNVQDSSAVKMRNRQYLGSNMCVHLRLKTTNRRNFLKQTLYAVGALACVRSGAKADPILRKPARKPTCSVYRAVNGSPEQNLAKIIELSGGIESCIGKDDIVLIKPNVQWWNQGAPNLQALSAFVDLIMTRPGGFEGEVVIAENCHRGTAPWQSRTSGYLREFTRNAYPGGVNCFNALGRFLKQRHGERFSMVHWLDVDKGGRRVFSPADGSGYVYCDGTMGVPLLSLDNGLQDNRKRSVIMTYPIFKTDQGTVVDFKNGIWERNGYSDRRIRFINFAAVNHHSTYCGATSAVKNYLGVSDLSGGPDPHGNGRLTSDYFNFHSFPFDKWAPGPVPGLIGTEIGMFMNTVRKADLNIATAEWIGLSDRTEAPVARTRAVIASVDPVALDYHTTKYLLYPNSRIAFHSPDNPTGPLGRYLRKCAEAGGGVFDESRVAIRSWDFGTRRFQQDDELVVLGRRYWGNNLKALGKYAVLRWAPWIV